MVTMKKITIKDGTVTYDFARQIEGAKFEADAEIG